MTKGYDPSETNSRSVMPEWKGAVPIRGLEEATGADAILSGITDMPLRSMGLVAEHVLGGAQLLAIKRTNRGSDMLDSVGERLQSHLLKMQLFFKEIGLPVEKWSAQACLLVTGIHLYRTGECYFGEQRQGHNAPYAYLVGAHERTSYKAYETAKNDWIARGGSVLTDCLTLAELPEYLDRQEQRLIGYRQQPIKLVLPPKPYVKAELAEITPGLQQLINPPPALVFLSRLPGMGPELAQRAIEFYLVEQGLSVVEALVQLASPAGNWCRGWGKGKAKTLEEALCLGLRPETPIDNKEEAIA